jgi:hypothetical protein
MMIVGVQFTGSVAAGASHRWFTWGWPADWEIVWTVVSTSPVVGAPQVEWDVAVERASSSAITYWITIRNLTSRPINIEARYAIMNL